MLYMPVVQIDALLRVELPVTHLTFFATLFLPVELLLAPYPVLLLLPVPLLLLLCHC